MKRLAIGTMLVAALGGATLLTLLRSGDYVLAVVNRPCPEEGEPGYDFMVEHCEHHRDVGDRCACVTVPSTLDDHPQFADQALELEAGDLFKRHVICKKPDGTYYVQFVPSDATVPPGWNCKVARDPDGTPAEFLFRFSQRGVQSPLFKAWARQCCQACGAERCWMSPGSWGMCPYCLFDDSCSTHCNPEEVGP